MKKRILGITVITASLLFFNNETNAQNNSDTVYYFIDTDFKSAVTTGTDISNAVYASSLIGTARWRDREKLINQFKIKLKERFPDQPGIDSKVVFRWQISMKEIKDSYALKETKMKNESYSIINLE